MQEVKHNGITKYIYQRLLAFIGNPYGVAGLMGNLYAESGLRSDNLQNSFEQKLGMTDEEYTDAVTNGTYTKFANDGAGYGLAQWTNSARKQNLLGLSKAMGAAIDSVEMQIIFLILELQNYSLVWNVLTKTSSSYEASDAVLEHYEKPATITDSSRDNRRSFSVQYYQLYGSDEKIAYSNDESVMFAGVLKRGSRGADVRTLQQQLKRLGYAGGTLAVDGAYGEKTGAAVSEFQRDYHLYSDGKAGAVTQYVLKLQERDGSRYTVVIGNLDFTSAMELYHKYKDAIIREGHVDAKNSDFV